MEGAKMFEMRTRAWGDERIYALFNGSLGKRKKPSDGGGGPDRPLLASPCPLPHISYYIPPLPKFQASITCYMLSHHKLAASPKTH